MLSTWYTAHAASDQVDQDGADADLELVDDVGRGLDSIPFPDEQHMQVTSPDTLAEKRKMLYLCTFPGY